MVMQPCDVIFVKHRKNASWVDRIIQFLVRWATGSDIFHVAYFVSAGIAFEANSFRQAGFVALKEYDEFEVKRLDFPKDQREEILKRIISTAGTRYGWGEVIALLLRKKFGIPIFYDNPKTFECAEELVKAVYEVTGIHIIDQTTGDISPADLWECPYLKSVVPKINHLL